MAENIQRNKNVKFTKEKSILARNLERLMKARGKSVIKLSEEAYITRQALYDILNDRTTPRESTLVDLAKALSTDKEKITADILKNGYRHFDYEFFRQQLYKIFPYEINEVELADYISGMQCDDIDSLDLEGFLVTKFDIDPVQMFVEKILPDKEIQNEIATYFGFKPEEIFKSYGGFPIGDNPGGFKHVNVAGKESFKDTEFQVIFERLDLKNKKIVMNLCMDLLQLQNN